MPPEENILLSDCALYSNGQPIGNLKSVSMDLSDDIRLLNENREFMTTPGREISFTINNVQWFPKILNKHRHLMLCSKSLRIKNKHKKIYNKLFNKLMTEFIGL